jgi:cellulose synthase/poly-beta-1,6-N-acetylglucosamine synthase-like glycosyltransferase
MAETSTTVPAIPLVTVVVAARNEAATIVRCIHSLCEQTHPALEIVVVDDRSSDATGPLAAAAGAIVISGEARGVGAARNRGVALARGAIVAFIDADAYAARDWLASLLDAFADSRLAAVGGVQLLPEDATAFQRKLQCFLECVGFVSDYVRPTNGRVRETTHNPGCNAAYRRGVFEAVGGLREDLVACEDLDLDRRLIVSGHRLGFTPAARVYHYRDQDVVGFRRWMRRYGAGHRQVVALHGRFRLLHWLPIAPPLCTLVLGILFYIWPASGGILVAGGIAATLAFLVVKGGPASLPSNARLLVEALIAWLRGYHCGKG